MEEVVERPLSILMIDNYFAVYRKRRRVLISGKAPLGLGGHRPPQARAWQAYQHRMHQEPPWERAERYRQTLQAQGSPSIRALARTLREDHSRIAKILKILELPKSALEALRCNSDNARLRARFTERRLRQMVRQGQRESTILPEIEQVLQGHT